MISFILGVALASAAPHHVFAFEARCVVIDASGKVIREVDLRSVSVLSRITDMDVSPDGTRLLVTAWSEEAKNTVLYELELETMKPRRVGGSAGFHAAPSYSRDGKWIQFAHHISLGGPVGMHEARAYAQLFRQPADASVPPTQLTTSDGCHMESTASAGDAIYFAHADCHGGRRLEVLSRGKERALTSYDSHLGEPSLSSDNKSLITTRVVGDELEIVELDIAKPEALRTLWKGTRFQEQFRPHYLGSTREVVFQNGRTVLRLSRTGSTATATQLWSFQ